MAVLFTYESSTGKLYKPDNSLVSIGYSGNGVYKNDPNSENIANHGPIPCGLYSIEGPPYDSPTHGPNVIHLIPDKDTKAKILSYGRQPYTFLMHGDKIGAPGTASDGCIIQPRATRDEVWFCAQKDSDPLLQVVANYAQNS